MGAERAGHGLEGSASMLGGLPEAQRKALQRDKRRHLGSYSLSLLPGEAVIPGAVSRHSKGRAE